MKEEPSIQDDQALIRRTLEGDQSAFELLVRKYEVKVFGTIHHMMRGNKDAEDLAQEVLIKVYRSLDTFKGDSAFSTWLYKITVNTCLDRLRVRPNFKEEPLDWSPDGSCHSGELRREILDFSGDPATILEQREVMKKVREAVYALPEKYRVVVVLKEFLDLSYEEMAVILETTVNALKVQLFRGKKMLKTGLREYLSV